MWLDADDGAPSLSCHLLRSSNTGQVMLMKFQFVLKAASHFSAKLSHNFLSSSFILTLEKLGTSVYSFVLLPSSTNLT